MSESTEETRPVGPALDIKDINAVKSFIRANTEVLFPPLVPEIKLYLAEESLPIWQQTEEQLQQQNIPPPFWAFAWAGGQALARYILDNPLLVKGKCVADIGTGSGLAALAAKYAGADKVMASDLDPLSVIAAELNGELNKLPISVTAENILEAPPSGFEVYIIADMFYERGLAETALNFAQSAKAQGATILVGDPQRNYFPTDVFTRLATYEVAVTRELEDALIKKTSVWQH